MSDELNADKINVFCELLAQNKGSFSVSHARKLEFKGNLLDIQEQLFNLGLSAHADLDVYTIPLTSITGAHRIVYDQWIDQDFDDDCLSQSIVFIHISGWYVEALNGKIVKHFGSGEFKDQIRNVITYYTLVKALKAEFVSDHHNEAKKEFVFYSSTRGVIRITYETVAARLSPMIKSNEVNELTELITSTSHKIFFINGLFKIANERPSIEIASILENAAALTTIIKRDYEISLKQFDFEKFKDSLLKEKDKYFNSIREIINKVFSQLIGIPISISASAFATYKVENESFTLALICFGFIFYVVIYVRIQATYKNDLNDIQLDFRRDFEDIKSKSGLTPLIIDTEKNKIENKIARTKAMINLMIGGIVVLGFSFVVYLSNQFLISLTNFSFLGLIRNLIMGCS